MTETVDAVLDRDGVFVLKQALSADQIKDMRAQVLAHKDSMARTRLAAHARHLAGFHRLAELSPLHEIFESNAPLQQALLDLFGQENARSIGLSDITINRSQHWHTDLLRGKYAPFLDGIDVWAAPRASCVKALAYLQDGKSLRYVRGSHKAPSPLDDAALEALAETADVTQLDVAAGDIVLMDLRTLHRGSSDAEMASPELEVAPKILVSTVYGHSEAALTQAMEKGNAARLADWDARHLSPAFKAT